MHVLRILAPCRVMIVNCRLYVPQLLRETFNHSNSCWLPARFRVPKSYMCILSNICKMAMVRALHRHMARSSGMRLHQFCLLLPHVVGDAVDGSNDHTAHIDVHCICKGGLENGLHLCGELCHVDTIKSQIEVCLQSILNLISSVIRVTGDFAHESSQKNLSKSTKDCSFSGYHDYTSMTNH